jgi:hypothetical protein
MSRPQIRSPLDLVTEGINLMYAHDTQPLPTAILATPTMQRIANAERSPEHHILASSSQIYRS